MRISQAAEKIGCTDTTVRQALRRLGISDGTGPVTSQQLRRLRREICPGGRGHWTKGKPRNPDAGRWKSTRQALRKLLRDRHEPGVVSVAVLAAHLGASSRSVRRWVSGESNPPAHIQAEIDRWITNQAPTKDES